MLVYSPLLAGVFLITVPLYLALMRFSSPALAASDLRRPRGALRPLRTPTRSTPSKGIETVKAHGRRGAFRELML